MVTFSNTVLIILSSIQAFPPFWHYGTLRKVSPCPTLRSTLSSAISPLPYPPLIPRKIRTSFDLCTQLLSSKHSELLVYQLTGYSAFTVFAFLGTKFSELDFPVSIITFQVCFIFFFFKTFQALTPDFWGTKKEKLVCLF